jgi:hypothetical protein
MADPHGGHCARLAAGDVEVRVVAHHPAQIVSRHTAPRPGEQEDLGIRLADPGLFRDAPAVEEIEDTAAAQLA